MTFKKLKEISRPHYYCFTIDKFLSRTLRSNLRKGSAVAALISFALSFGPLPLYFGFADGLFFLFIFVYLSLSFLEFFYQSMKSEGLSVMDYALSSILFVTDEIDATKALFESKVGAKIFQKIKISSNEYQIFIHSDRSSIIATSLNLEGESVNLRQYVEVLYDADKSLQIFLYEHSVNKEIFLDIANEVMKTEEVRRRKERFWSRENLGAISKGF